MPQRPRAATSTPGSRTTRTRKRAVTRRSEILDAAAKSFRQTGYGGASLDSVAAAVGILKGSLYYHFASKEDILAELLLDVHRDALGMIEDVSACGGSGIERVEAYVAAHARWAVRHLDRVEVFLRDYHHLPAQRAREVAALRRRFSDYLTGCIVQAQREGTADPSLDPRVAANSIHGMLNWIGNWYRSTADLSEEALATQIARQAVRGLAPLAGAAGRRRGAMVGPSGASDGTGWARTEATGPG